MFNYICTCGKIYCKNKEEKLFAIIINKLLFLKNLSFYCMHINNK